MRAYRVYFKKNGINLTKLVYAESLLEVINQFKNMEIVMIKELDLLPEGDIDVTTYLESDKDLVDLLMSKSYHDECVSL